MTTKTLTLTIPELCALKMGDSDIVKWDCDGDTFYATLRKNGHSACVLSVGDPFPMDECQICNHPKKSHTPTGFGGEKCIDCYNSQERSRIFPAHNFKPRLAVVKGIKLVKRCECGYEYQKEHMCDYEQNKPVQMVEIKTEVE